MNVPSQAPNPAIRRLSLYLRQLETLDRDRVATVSSQELARSLGLTDVQVRKDLTHFGQFGRPGVGYEVMPLMLRLRGILGTDRISRALLVGAGNLGRAIVAYRGFRSRGFELVAVFDSAADKVGQRLADLTVQPMSDLPTAASRHGARLAIVAVPADAAQGVADQLTAAGIRGILNFAPTQLEASPGVTVCNLDVAAELEHLHFLIETGSPDVSDRKAILIVDDDDANVVFLSQIAEDNGYRSRVARNGEEASLALRESRPDLVLLDIMMPRKSGIAVFQEMKEDADLRKIPIVIVSGASAATGIDLMTGGEIPRTSDEGVGGREYGTALHETLKGLEPDGFVEKPIDPVRLSGKLNELLS